MENQGESGLCVANYRSLSLQQRARLRRAIAGQAHAAHGELMKAIVSATGRLMVCLALGGVFVFVRWWAAIRRRRIEARASAELQALDDIMLRDMGLSRGEIGTAGRGGLWRSTRRDGDGTAR